MKRQVEKFLPKVIGFKLNSLFLIRPYAAASQAFQLFCEPRRGKVKSEQEDFLNPVKDEKLAVDGESVQTYHWKGSKKTILLLHGWESNTSRWEQLVEKLQSASYNIVAFDAPAHGNSSGKLFQIPLYSECVDLMVEKFQPEIIIGHSMGAMTVIYNQHFHPSANIKKIVLLGGPSELTQFMKDFQKTLNLKPRFMTVLEEYFHRKFGFTFAEFSAAEFVKTLQNKKGLLIHDAYDKIVNVRESKAIHENWKGSELFVTEGAGHSLNNEMILEKVARFIEE